MNNSNEMVHVRSLDPNERRRKPRLVPRKLLGTAAAKNHKIVEVRNPDEEPVPQRIAPLPPPGPDPRDLEIKELRAKLAEKSAPAVVEAASAPAEEQSETKRGPGRPRKHQD